MAQGESCPSRDVPSLLGTASLAGPLGDMPGKLHMSKGLLPGQQWLTYAMCYTSYIHPLDESNPTVGIIE